MPNISLDTVDTINSKLGQADAITTLLMCECDSGSQLSDELRSYVLSFGKADIPHLLADVTKRLPPEVRRYMEQIKE